MINKGADVVSNHFVCPDFGVVSFVLKFILGRFQLRLIKIDWIDTTMKGLDVVFQAEGNALMAC